MLLGSILMALAWAALQGEVTLANLFVGYVLGYAVLALLEKGGVLPSAFQAKVAGAVGLGAFFVRELLVANVRVALDVTSDAEILLLSALINITPGSVTVDLSDDRRTLFVHVMHMSSPEASRLEIKSGFEQRVKRLFE